jgi:hypothetical protein
MASRGGGRGGHRGGRRGNHRRRPPPKVQQESEELGTRELDLGDKKYYIDIKANEQGKFIKIVETQSSGRGRLIFNIEKAFDLRDALTKFIEKCESLGPIPADLQEQETVDSVEFRHKRRFYYCDLRQNQNGRFVKLTQFSGPDSKFFVFIPSSNLKEFRDALSALLDEHGDGEPPAPEEDDLPNSREVRAGGKKFYFDVSQNDRGVFLRLSEVQANRRNHLNIPHYSWSKMAEVFAALCEEMPYNPPPREEEEQVN